MKRYGHLWEGMIAFENLLKAAEKARAAASGSGRRRPGSSSTWSGS